MSKENCPTGIVTVFLSYKWEDTEMYCLQEMAKLTPDHMVVYLDLADDRLDPEKLLIDAKRHNPKTKLLILTNINKSISKYNQIVMLHVKFEEKCKAGVPFFNSVLEDQLCPEHDRMSTEMQRSCDKQVALIKAVLNDENPYYTNKNKVF